MNYTHLKRKHWKEFDVEEYDKDVYPTPFIKRGEYVGYPYGWDKNKNQFIEGDDKQNFPSASQWTNTIVQSIHCLVVQCDNQEEVIPTPPERKKFSYDFPPSMIELMESNITKSDLITKQWEKIFTKDPHPLVFAFFSSLEKQIEYNTTSGEDKRETYTDKWVTDLLRCLGCDSYKGRFRVNPSEECSFRIAGKICKAILDIRVDDKYLNIMCWFDESKRLKPSHTPYEDQIKCQKVAETIAFANSIRDIAKGRDVEVFCIGARHTFISFSHTIVPISYLDCISNKGIQELDDPNCHIIHKIHTKNSENIKYPHGYDITNPIDRKVIIEFLWNIFGYIASEGIFRANSN